MKLQQPTVTTDKHGDKSWRLNGELHRTDGPAVEWADGGKSWYLNGKRHRTDGPAVERANGTKEWLLNGKRHRTDGPAVERANGTKEWWLNGKYLGWDVKGFLALWAKLTTDEQRAQLLLNCGGIPQ